MKRARAPAPNGAPSSAFDPATLLRVAACEAKDRRQAGPSLEHELTSEERQYRIRQGDGGDMRRACIAQRMRSRGECTERRERMRSDVEEIVGVCVCERQ